MNEEYIVCVTLPGTPEHFSRTCSGKVTVGRSEEADIQLVHPMVSRRHAEMELAEDGSFLVRDLASRNGTVVNDDLIQDRACHAGDAVVVQIGPYMLRLVTRAAAEGDTLAVGARPPRGRVTLDRSQRLLMVDGETAIERLTGLEYRLMEVLTTSSPALVENRRLGDDVWGEGLWDSYMLHNLVRRVRRKLEAKGLEADQLLVSVPGGGYRVV
jgi:predicted component of type VI protein secretion system